MEQDTQHKIEVLSKRRCNSQLHQFVDWSYPMPNHRQTYHVLRRPRKPQYYQQNWRRFVPNGFTAHRSYGGQAILWEIDKVDRQIHALQSEINVLQQQLNIIRNYCAPSTETFGSQQANQGPSIYNSNLPDTQFAAKDETPTVN